jgi:hypothetical protein
MARKGKFINQIVEVPINDITPNDYNPNYMPSDVFNALKEHTSRIFWGGIIVRKDPDNEGKYVIIDGEHRYLALKANGNTQIPCYIAPDDFTLDEAVLETITINKERGYLTPVETGQLLKGLNSTIPHDILAKKVGISPTELGLMMNLKFDPNLQKLTKEISNLKSWADIETLINEVVKRLKLKDFEGNTIYTIGKGGIIPARLVADRIGLDHIEINAKKIPKNAIFIDDIYDTGETYNKIMEKVGKDSGLTYITLYKRKGMKPPLNLIFGSDTAGKEYIVFPWDRFEYKRDTAKKSSQRRNK